MSTVGSALIECADVQGSLTSYFNTCGHATFSLESPFLQFIYSAENKSGIEQVINYAAGKVRDITLVYNQKIPTSQVTEITECGVVCTATTKRGNLSTTYSIDHCEKLQIEELIEFQDLVRICEDNGRLIFGKIAAMEAALEAKIAEKTAEEATALIGAWATTVKNQDGTAVSGHALEVATRLYNTYNLDPRFLSTIDFAFKRTQYCARPVIFGSSILAEAWSILRAGCCASDGLNLAEMLSVFGRSSIMVMDDYVIDAMSDDAAIATHAGALQLLTYTMGQAPNFRPPSTAGASNFEVIPMTTNRYGIPYDLTISNNCGALSLIMTTTTKLVGAPTDLFPAGDKMTGVTGVNEINVVTPINPAA